jgi:hypothetical protein
MTVNKKIAEITRMRKSNTILLEYSLDRKHPTTLIKGSAESTIAVGQTPLSPFEATE